VNVSESEEEDFIEETIAVVEDTTTAYDLLLSQSKAHRDKLKSPQSRKRAPVGVRGGGKMKQAKTKHFKLETTRAVVKHFPNGMLDARTNGKYVHLPSIQYANIIYRCIL
jgi:hypothetical protein